MSSFRERSGSMSLSRSAGAAAAPIGRWVRRRDATDRGAAPSTVSEDDLALSRALVSGDMRAFEQLIERESATVFRACYRVLGRVDEAEEATQEAFVLAFRALGTFRGDGHPAAWLMRIATREAWRRSSTRAQRGARSLPIDEAALAIPSPRSDPSQRVLLMQEHEAIRTAVRQLPEPYREVITLRYFGDLSLGEISAATKRPMGTVKAQVHRGLQRLRGLLEDDGR